MATLAFTAVGALVGSQAPEGFNINGQSGTALGAAAGAIIGNVLFAPDTPDQNGPRLKDKGVTVSTYGADIARLYGTNVVAGMVIWSTDKQENVHTQSSGKGIAGGTETSNYAYSVSCAVACCEGVVDELLMIYADGNKIYDSTGSTSDIIKVAGLNFRFYNGTDTQLPDSTVQADVGAANAPAYRGTAYVVFEDLQLEAFGNRIPNFTFLLTRNPTDVYNTLTIDQNWSNINLGSVLTNHNTGRTVYLNENFLYGINHYDMSVTWIADQNYTRILFISDDDYVYVTQSGGDGEVHRIRAETGQVVFERIAPLGENYANLQGGAYLDMRHRDQGEYLVCGSTTEQIIYLLDFRTLELVARTPLATGSDGVLQNGPIIQETNDGLGGRPLRNIWAIQRDNVSTDDFYLMQIDETFIYVAIETPGVAGYNDDMVLTLTSITKADAIGPDSTQSTTFGIWPLEYNSANDTMIAASNNAIIEIDLSNTLNKGDIVERDIILQGTAPFNRTATVNWVTGLPSMGKVTYMDFSNTMQWVDTFTLESLQLELGSGNPWGVFYIDAIQQASRFAIDYTRNALHGIFNFQTSTVQPKAYKIFPERVTGGGALLTDIVGDVIEQTGLVTADYDVTDLAGLEVPGYLIAVNANAKSYLAPLMTAYSFDIIESDFKIKAVLRGTTFIASVPQDDLVRLGKVLLPESRIQEIELPSQVYLNFIDFERNYEQSGTTSRRIGLPVPTMFSKNIAQQTLPIAMGATQAKQIADKVLFANWAERRQLKAAWGWKYLQFDPSDIIEVTANGLTQQARIDEQAIGANLANQLTLTVIDDGTYTSTVVADSGQGYLSNDLLSTPWVTLILLDLPLLTDTENPTGDTNFVYAVLTVVETGFRGASIFEEQPDGSFVYVQTLQNDVAVGSTTTVLADHPAELTDETSSVTVFSSKPLVSSTLTILNDQLTNACLIGSEILQFATVVDNGDSTYTLTDFLRGRRGTEAETAGHTTGEQFILLETQSVITLNIDISRLGETITFLTKHFDSDLGHTATITWNAVNLKPWSPAQLLIVDNISTLDLSWERRNRNFATWDDGSSEIANSESLEQYEIDFTVGATTVTKVVNDATTYSYPVAEFDSDFGESGFAGAAPILVNVYQMSSVVGRGFPATGTT